MSTFIPFEKQPHEKASNAVRLNQLIKTATEALKSRGVADEACDRWLSPLLELKTELKNESLITNKNTLSLAIYNNGETVYWFQLPYHLDQACVLSNRFYLKPLLAMQYVNEPVYLLSLERKNTKLYKHTVAGLEEVKVPEIPNTIDEVTWADDVEKSLQNHAGGSLPVAGGSGSTMETDFHGQGVPSDKKAEQIERFNAEVARSTSKLFNNRSVVLGIVADERNLGLFEKSADLKRHHIFKLDKDPHSITNDELAEICSQEAFEAHLRRCRDTIEEIESNQSKSVYSIDDAALDASQGRLDRLLVDEKAGPQGICITELNRVKRFQDDQAPENAHDLVDIAVQETLAHGGDVLICDESELPGSAMAVGLRRY